MGGSGDKAVGGIRGRQRRRQKGEQARDKEQRAMQTDRWEGGEGRGSLARTEAQVPGGAAGELGER